MAQEFNKVTTTSNFIKNLLISTYLPLIRTVRDFDFIIDGRLYVYKCEIIKCTKSGYLVTGYKNVKFDGDRAEYRVITEYHFGERNDKLCTNFISNSEGYDSLTHERLGKYLRNLRDMYELNLMPLYNCFSNQILQAHHISKNGVDRTSAEYNTKIYKVPIRFNTDYTICMDNLGMTTFAPAFIKNNNLLKINNTRFGNGVDVTNKYIKLHRTGVIKNKVNTRFKAPFVIRFNNIPETKKVLYSENSIKKIDSLHTDYYYQKYDDDMYDRGMYYIRNSGEYNVCSVTQEEFESNPTKYYYSDDGVIVQCSQTDSYNPSITYFISEDNQGRYTYLPTSLTPDNADDVVLYVGVEPSTGRIDSITESSLLGFWSTSDTINTDIATWSIANSLYFDEEVLSGTYSDDTFFAHVNEVRTFDSINFDVVCLWEQCTKYSSYSESETYYIRNNGRFEEWDYELGESTFNENKTFYYIKLDDGTYQQCTQSTIYDSDTVYYVYSNNKYITSQNYYFMLNYAEFYIATGFQQEPENYYILQNGSFTKLTGSAIFDINNTYALPVQKELFPWRVLDDDNHLIPSNDTYIHTDKEYYSSYYTQTTSNYIYDITEENCALYDYSEENLYLLIQVPKSYEPNIVILEGDYTNTQSEKIIDDSEVERLPSTIIDYLYTSSLKLMQMPSKKPVPFSDVLIEFLLWNAINNLDSINNNMDRLLIAIGKVTGDPLAVNHYANYWYAQYRKVVSEIGRYSNNIVVTDNLGYVTKNLEQVINTTANNDSFINDYPYGD